MTKADIVTRIAEEAKVTKAVAAKAFDAVFASVADALKQGDKITIVGFGTFSVTGRKGRIRRNPQTGKEIKIAARKAPKFTAGKLLKDAVGNVPKAKAKAKAKKK